jgi:hypothetical protein
MPALRNLKHEAFARNLVEMTKSGGTQGNAYSKAGYKCENGAAEAAASRMLADVKNGVADRVRELMAAGAKRAETTITSLLNELEETRIGATSVEQFSAATAAIIGKAKIAGLMSPDRLEIGAPGSFGHCQTTEDIADRVLGDMSVQEALEVLDGLRAALEQRAASQAIMIEPPPAARPGNETALALASLRPSRRK